MTCPAEHPNGVTVYKKRDAWDYILWAAIVAFWAVVFYMLYRAIYCPKGPCL